jgi:hypothetical protein
MTWHVGVFRVVSQLSRDFLSPETHAFGPSQQARKPDRNGVAALGGEVSSGRGSARPGTRQPGPSDLHSPTQGHIVHWWEAAICNIGSMHFDTFVDGFTNATSGGGDSCKGIFWIGRMLISETWHHTELVVLIEYLPLR